MAHMTYFTMVISNCFVVQERWRMIRVALSTDEFNQIKHKKSYYDYEQRKMMLESIRYVDLVIPEKGWGQKEDDVEKFDVDVFVMGHDWEGEFDFLRINVKSFI